VHLLYIVKDILIILITRLIEEAHVLGYYLRLVQKIYLSPLQSINRVIKMSQKPPSIFIVAAPLFLVLFIDSMGLGLVFPLLNTLVLSPQANFLPMSVSPETRNLIFGLTISLYMFCWFFGAAILGDLSDQIGRKKALMICLIGSFFGYALSALAVVIHSFSCLLVGRIIAGFTAGSQSIAQAAIVDISTDEHKARNLGLMLFVISVGFVFGPLIGGVLSSSALSPYFSFAMPFYFAAAISLINAILLQYAFKETFTHTKKVVLKLHHAIAIFASAFRNEKVRELSIVLLVFIFGWAGFYSFISMFLLKVYNFTSLQTGLYMGLLGIGFGIGTGILVDPCVKYFKLKRCVTGGCAVCAIFAILIITAPSTWLIWLYIAPLGAAAALAYSTIITLFSNQVGENEQGWVMGVTGAIMAFAFALNGIVVGLLADLNVYLPMIVTIIGLLLASILMPVIYKG